MQEKYNQQKLLNEKNQLKIENNTIFLHIPLKITHKHFNYRESTQNCGTDLQSGGAKIPDILSS